MKKSELAVEIRKSSFILVTFFKFLNNYAFEYLLDVCSTEQSVAIFKITKKSRPISRGIVYFDVGLEENLGVDIFDTMQM